MMTRTGIPCISKADKLKQKRKEAERTLSELHRARRFQQALNAGLDMIERVPCSVADPISARQLWQHYQSCMHELRNRPLNDKPEYLEQFEDIGVLLRELF